MNGWRMHLGRTPLHQKMHPVTRSKNLLHGCLRRLYHQCLQSSLSLSLSLSLLSLLLLSLFLLSNLFPLQLLLLPLSLSLSPSLVLLPLSGAPSLSVVLSLSLLLSLFPAALFSPYQASAACHPSFVRPAYSGDNYFS